MGTKSLPGFNAESSIYRSSVQYSGSVAESSVAIADILPQLRWLPRPGQPIGPKNCDPSCVCVTCEGCPCCASLCPWLTDDPFKSLGAML